MNINKTKQRCAISMESFGISTVVMTSIEKIQWIEDQYNSQPDWTWCDGRGKKYLHESLKAELKLQDSYFNKHSDLVNEQSEEWGDFCEDCILLFVLDALLLNKPYELIHPDTYAANISHAAIDATGGMHPELISDIPVVN
jgi:hypothetical protein